MESLLTLLSHPFTWGLLLGLLIASFSAWSHWKTKRELSRFQRHLSDKLELEAKHLEGLKSEREKLAKENENLRLRVGMLNEKPENKQSRDLEVLTRAEKRMVMQAPGFAAAWETAKSDAATELEAEDQGRSLPKRLFSRLLGVTHDGDAESQSVSEFDETGKNSPTRGDSEAGRQGSEGSASAPNAESSG